jgi:hypothetical protein
LLQNKLKTLEQKISRLTEDNKKIDELSQQRMKEIENWKNQYNNQQVSQTEYDKIKKDAEQYKIQYYDLQQEKLNFQSQKSSLER